MYGLPNLSPNLANRCCYCCISIATAHVLLYQFLLELMCGLVTKLGRAMHFGTIMMANSVDPKDFVAKRHVNGLKSSHRLKNHLPFIKTKPTTNWSWENYLLVAILIFSFQKLKKKLVWFFFFKSTLLKTLFYLYIYISLGVRAWI